MCLPRAHRRCSRATVLTGRLAVLAAATLLLSIASVPVAAGQGPPDLEAMMQAQRIAMKKLDFMDGVWRGPAWTILPTGERMEFTQTERIGPFLDGTVKVVEGLGYDSDGNVAFNALAIISYNIADDSYDFRSYARGFVGDFKLVPTDDGFTWEIPAGPMTIRYTATIQDGSWHEVGDRIMPGQEPVRFVEFTVKRKGDTSWPVAGQIRPE